MNGYLINFSTFRQTRVWNVIEMYILRATNAMFKPSARAWLSFDLCVKKSEEVKKFFYPYDQLANEEVNWLKALFLVHSTKCYSSKLAWATR